MIPSRKCNKKTPYNALGRAAGVLVVVVDGLVC